MANLPLAPERPFVLRPDGQAMVVCSVGVCDPAMSKSISGLLPFLYDTSIFQATVAANGDPIVLANAQSRNYFELGPGDTIAGGWWAKTQSDTTALSGGQLIARGLKFIGMGIMVEALDGFIQDGDTPAADNARERPAFMENAEDGPGYTFELQRALLNYVAFTLRFGTTGCEYNLGVAAHNPHYGQPRGTQTVQNGGFSVVTFTPFTTAVCIGAKDEYDQLIIRGTFGSTDFNIDSGSPPTEAGTIYNPVRLSVVGMIVCVPDAYLCGLPAAYAGPVPVPGAPGYGLSQGTIGALSGASGAGPGMIGAPVAYTSQPAALPAGYRPY